MTNEELHKVNKVKVDYSPTGVMGLLGVGRLLGAIEVWTGNPRGAVDAATAVWPRGLSLGATVVVSTAGGFVVLNDWKHTSRSIGFDFVIVNDLRLLT